MTDAEIRLWQRLRGRQLAGFKFRRPHPFLDYVLDFVCLEACLVVEVDGVGSTRNARAILFATKRWPTPGFALCAF